jgi:hypothetical protein
MSIYTPQKNRKRLVATGVVASLAATAIVGGTFAGLTATAEQEGHSITGQATFGMEFLEGSGLINANVSPGESAQEFEITARNGGNLSGQLAFNVKDGASFEFSDAMLDQTMVSVWMNESYAYANFDVTLREFLTNAFVSTQIVRGGEDYKIRIKVQPAGDASNWTAEDLGEFTQSFASVLTLSAVGAEGTSDLGEYAVANGTFLGEYNENKKFYSIPVEEVLPASENGVTDTVVAE